MKLLAIDTTEAGCSAALLINGEIRERYEIAPRTHSDLILPMMDSLLNEAGLSVNGLDGLGFARGPGSFTGVRIAAAVTQGLAVAANLPVVPVSSLLALAQGARRVYTAERVLAGFDARMNEVYWASCEMSEDGIMQLCGDEQVCSPQEVAIPDDRGWCGVGSAWEAYENILTERLGKKISSFEADVFVHAQDVAVLAAHGLETGQAVSAEFAVPVYLRDQVAKKKAER